jgi:Uma2 family endonuclease
MTYHEYVAAERNSDLRHEFIAGQVFAMAGGTPEHGAIAAALIRELGLALRDKPCRVYSSDVRVRIAATGLTTYPDASVVCGQLEIDAMDADAIANPVLLVEVLSDSREAYDRGAKAAHYRRIPSLGEYALVAQHEPLIEVYRRNELGRFELYEARIGDRIELTSVGAIIDVKAVYDNPLAAPTGH